MWGFALLHAGLAVEAAEPEHLFSLWTGGMQQAFLYVCWWRTMTYFLKKIIILNQCVADPDPGSGAFLDPPGSGIQDG